MDYFAKSHELYERNVELEREVERLKELVIEERAKLILVFDTECDAGYNTYSDLSVEDAIRIAGYYAENELRDEGKI